MKVGEPEADTQPVGRSGVPHINTVGVKGRRNCLAAAAERRSLPVHLCAVVSIQTACVVLYRNCRTCDRCRQQPAISSSLQEDSSLGYRALLLSTARGAV
jgi:hypothetical protein